MTLAPKDAQGAVPDGTLCRLAERYSRTAGLRVRASALHPLLRWADAPEDVLPLSVLYLRIYFLGVPALVVYNFGSALLRAVGDTFIPCCS